MLETRKGLENAFMSAKRNGRKNSCGNGKLHFVLERIQFIPYIYRFDYYSYEPISSSQEYAKINFLDLLFLHKELKETKLE